MKYTIDISKWNTVTDWPQAAQNIEKIIIRCGFRGYGSGKIAEDNRFKEFAGQCKVYGIPFGLYFMSQAITIQEGREEAEYIVGCAKDYGAALPLFIDSEDGDGTAAAVRADKLSKRLRTDIVKVFCEHVAELGYPPGIYASEAWFQDQLYYEELQEYLIWCAKYNSNNGAPGTKPKWPKVDIWQYTSNGSIPGINGKVDLNEWYIDIDSPAAVHTYQVPTEPLQTGCRGDSVKWLQLQLNRYGYHIAADGIYGPKTAEAVSKFKKLRGLDLIADAMVYAELNNH